MAVVPSLAAMAALTLFQNPHTQPEGTTVDYSDWRSPATVIQRRQRRRIGAVNRIAAAIRGWKARMVHIAFPLHNQEWWTWSRMREHLRRSMFTHPYNMYPYAVAPLMMRRSNMLEARRNYRSTSRNRTFGNIPLGMQ